MKVRIHIENDRSAPEAQRVTPEGLTAALGPDLASRIQPVFDDDPDRFLSLLPETNPEILLTCRKLDLTAAKQAAPALDWVQVTSAGVEAYLPTLPDGLALTNASGVHGQKGGEFILAAVLMLNLEIPRFVTAKERGDWSPTYGGTIAGKTVTILGVGAIGRRAAAMLRPFGVKLAGATRSGRTDADLDRCIGSDDPGALDELLRETDILVSTLPLTPRTAGLIDRRRIELLPGGAGVVVVGRARVFDYDALMDRLEDGTLGGAVLDVFPTHPVPPDDRLWQCPRLVMTPHCSLDDHTVYASLCLAIFAENFGRRLAGAPLINVVEPDLGY